MSDIKLSKCLFVDLQTDEQRRDWFSLGRGVATGIIAPALQPHLTIAYSKIVESKNIIEQQQARIAELESQLKEEKNIYKTTYSLMLSGEKRGVEKATEELQPKIDELATMVERLRDALQNYTAEKVCCGQGEIQYSSEGEPIGQECCGKPDIDWPEDVTALLEAPPHQNLNATKRALQEMT